MMVGRVFLVLTGACQFGHGVGGKGEIAGIPCGTAKNKPKKFFALTRGKKKNTKKHENTPKKHPQNTKKTPKKKISR